MSGKLGKRKKPERRRAEESPQGPRSGASGPPTPDSRAGGIRVPAIASVVSVLVGCLVLFGWQFDLEVLKRIVPGVNAMNPVSAVCFILLGISLWLLRTEGPGRAALVTARALASVVALVGLIKIFQYVAGWEFGVDQLLFRDKLGLDSRLPNRIGYVTAINFSLLGGALLLLDTRTRGGRWPAQYLAVAVAFATCLPVLGYVYGVPAFYGTFTYLALALHTALAFVVLAAGVLYARPDRGMMRVMLGGDLGGVIMRRLLPLVVLLPIVLGWLRLQGELLGLYDARLGVAIFATSMMVILSLVIGWTAGSLHRTDAMRQRTEEELRESEERIRTMVDGVKDYAIFMLDPQGNVTTWNAGAERNKGYRAEEIIGQHFSRFYTQEDVERGHPENELRIAASEGRYEEEGPRVRKDGSLFWASVLITALRDEARNLRGFAKIVRDITERRRVEQALWEANTLRHAIIDSANFTIISTDPDGTIRTFSSTAQCLLGYRSDEVVGKATPAIFHDPIEVAARAEELTRELGTTIEPGFEALVAKARLGRPDENEWTYIRKDGSRFPVRLSVTALRDAEGEISGFLGIGADITDQKRAERKIHRQNDLLNVLHEASLKLLNRLEADELLRDIAGRAAELLDATGGHVSTVDPDGASEGGTLMVRAAMGSVKDYLGLRIGPGEGFNGKVWQTGEPGIISVPYDSWGEPTRRVKAVSGISAAVAVPIFSGEGVIGVIGVSDDREDRAFGEEDVAALEQFAGLAAVALDNARLYATAQQELAERTKAQRKLEVFSAELQRSNRELQDFARVASHDLQEPLRKVRAFGDRLKAKHAGGLEERGLDYLNRMQTAAGRMQVLIEDLLILSRVTTQARPFEEVDLSKVVRQVLEDLETQVERTGGRVETSPLPIIDADPTQMRQLFQNLISNALKFHREDEPPVVTVEGKVLDGVCEISVQDNGIGFDQAYEERIFTVFERLHGRQEYEGTGVGLAVCKKIAERHSGSITARSVPGEGTTFIITLPARNNA